MTLELRIAGTVTSKEALRQWKAVTDKALREPVIITSHGRPRHVLMAYEEYARLRDRERQVFRTDELPTELAEAILADLPNLRAPLAGENESVEDDTIIE
jgi:prevent-host-death family protein